MLWTAVHATAVVTRLTVRVLITGFHLDLEIGLSVMDNGHLGGC